ncbi:MAG TPA: shikimate dehydrogenase [Acidimicrobiia bacterium]|nr:shikimate dehydrogenase [Acidimicrobiia bacterium]
MTPAPARISGTTRVAGIIGDPVRHSLSPVLHNAAYRELGLDWIYAAFEVPETNTRGALDAMRVLDLVGLSVTMPHKTAAAECCDRLSADAAALRSVNSVSIDADGSLVGDSTDGEGFLRSLRDAGHDPASASAVVLGAGGAGRAVARALGRRGARVVVCARNPDAAAVAAELAGGSVISWADRAGAAQAAELVVNATSIGMGGGASDADPLPLDLDALHPGQVVADLVYHPRDTALLEGARARGAAAVDGLGMLVHQAALQIELWSGLGAPIAVMRAAAEQALGEVATH